MACWEGQYFGYLQSFSDKKIHKNIWQKLLQFIVLKGASEGFLFYANIKKVSFILFFIRTT